MSSDPGPDFAGAYGRAWERNCASFVVGDAADKIKTFSKKTGIGEDAVRQKIRGDPIFKMVFVKEPRRQNIYEREAAGWLRRQPGIDKFRRLDTRGRMVCAVRVIPKAVLRKKGGSAATWGFDFKWTTRGRTVYAAHKYTLESGGSQDAQYEDLYDFIDAANQSRAPGAMFIVIVDGPYYGTRDAARRATRMEALRQAANGKTVFAGRSADVPKILRDNVP